MQEETRDIVVVSQNTLCSSQDGKSHPLSVRVAALRSAIPPELQSFENSEVIVFLLSLVEGMSREMMSPDKVWFAHSRAEQLCLAVGIDESRFKELQAAIAPAMERCRRSNPISLLH
jgi:hypothetical protein